MQLGGRPAVVEPADDVATALRAVAASAGHRPAITVLRGDGEGGVRREEQGFASLAQWAAKGAHLLEADLLAEPGDAVAVLGPPGWLPAAVAWAAWWSGLVVTDDVAAALVVVAHEDVDVAELALATDAEVLRWGDAADGGCLGAVAEEAWASAVQAFPDAPPPPRASPDAAALAVGDAVRDQRALIADAAALAPDARTVGVDAADAPSAEHLALALARPLARGRATVLLLDGVERAAAAGERVTRWLGDA